MPRPRRSDFLKHALAMESFNFSIKQFGVPLTLSSIGRNYVFEK
jgi:hypothetical protein